MSRYTDLMIAQGATHHWSFDELTGTTALDTITTGGINLTITDTTARENPAVVKSALVFAATKYATYTNDTTMPFVATQPFSFSYMFRNDSVLTTGNARGIVSRRNNSTIFRSFGSFLYYANSAAQGGLTIDFGDNQNRWETSFVPVIGTWYHNAITWDPATSRVSLYVNGVLYGSSGKAPDNSNATANFYIGCLGGGTSTQNFIGPIDEVAVFVNKLLSPTEIAAQYATAFPITRIFDGTNWQDADKKVL